MKLTNNLSIESLIEMYENRGFDYQQMTQIKKGLMNGIDVSKYARTCVDSRKMVLIRILLEQGYDVSTVADPTIDTWEAKRRTEKILNKDVATKDLWK